MRRIFVLGAIATLASISLMAPGAGGQASLGPPPEAGDGGSELGGFHGFNNFQTHAQSHVASLVGYLGAFREENRLAAALSEINGPPANSRNIAGMYQRGEGARFVYGVIGGGGGERGTLPDPPPGEVGAYYPTDPPEDTWQGPITAANRFQALDGRAHAKATDVPTGEANAAVTHVEVPGYFIAEVAAATSRTEPAKGGVEAEAVSVLRGVTAGPMRIESVTSRAYAFLPMAAEDPQGVATTVIEGATVNDIPVTISDKGVLVGANASPGAQGQVNAALLGAGFKEVSLTPAKAVAGEDKQSVRTSTGSLSFVHYDEKFGASNPQGFSGGGFTVGGAEASAAGSRCAPDCPGASSGAGEVPELGVAEGVPARESGGAESSAPYSSAPSDSSPSSPPSPSSSSAPTPSQASFGAPSGGFGPGLSAGAPSASRGVSGGVFSAPGASSTGAFTGAPVSGSTTAVTPEEVASPPSAPEPSAAASAAVPEVASPPILKALALEPESADWMRDLYLALATGAMVIVIAQRVVKAR